MEQGGWIEQCNFSDNFHDPSFGWGENGRRGGIVLDRVERSTIAHCRANRVWDACVLVNSSDNIIEDNDFSHTSNTALKLWTSSRNRVRRNNLSYGLREEPRRGARSRLDVRADRERVERQSPRRQQLHARRRRHLHPRAQWLGEHGQRPGRQRLLVCQ